MTLSKATPLSPIRVVCEPRYSNEHSLPDDLRYVYIYHITIHNESQQPAQLLSRYWKITDADGGVQEVKGDGVIGEQPLIKPKQPYEYESFCVLTTPLGWMEGHYNMIDEHGQAFEAPIPRFQLQVPGILQ